MNLGFSPAPRVRRTSKSILIDLFLCKQLFFPFVTIMFRSKTDLHYASKFSCLIFYFVVIDNNEFIGTITTEVGLLTEITSLELCKRLFTV